MKIACICTSDIPSSKANAIQVMKVMDSSLELDHQVRLWVPGQSTYDLNAIKQMYGMQQISTISWIPSRPVWKRYDFIAQSFFACLFWKSDLLYTWTLQSAILAMLFKIPVILELHDRPTGRVGKRAFKHFVKHNGHKRLLLITHALREALQQEEQVDLTADWVQIAPNGIDLRQYPETIQPQQARTTLGIAEQFTAVFTGHFYAGRGIELLFGLAQTLPHIQFLWVGGTDDLVASWRQRLQIAGVKNVVLTGFISQQELPLYQAAGDVLLMPYGLQIAGSSGGNSAEICSPMKMFDYLATGRPIISSELPVLHEILNEANTIFCPAKDIQAWADALNRLVENPQDCKKMGAHARDTALQYTWLKRTQSALDGFEQA